MSENEMVEVEFYGANGYCLECHQPLEGRGCPYCGWEDKSPAQHGYVPKKEQPIGYDALKVSIDNLDRELKQSVEVNDALIAERELLLKQLEIPEQIRTANWIMEKNERVFSLTAERDLLRQQLDVAMKALNELIIGKHVECRCGDIAEDAKAEIAKLGEKK